MGVVCLRAASTVSLANDRHHSLGLALPDFAALLSRQLAVSGSPRRPSLPDHLLAPPVNLIKFQSTCRALLVRRQYPIAGHRRAQKTRQTSASCDSVPSVMSEADFQGAPGLLALQARIRTKQQRDKFRATSSLAVKLQAQCRGVLWRRTGRLEEPVTVVEALQAAARGFIVRRSTRAIRAFLNGATVIEFAVMIQNKVRACLARRRVRLVRLRLWIVEPEAIAIQASCRQVLARRDVRKRRTESAAALMTDLVGLQAVVKRLLTLKELAEKHNEHWIEVAPPPRRGAVQAELEDESIESNEIILRSAPPPRPPRLRDPSGLIDEGVANSPVISTGIDAMSQRMVDLLTELEAIEADLTELDTIIGMAVWHRAKDKTAKADEAWLRLVLSKANGCMPFEVDDDGERRLLGR